MPKAEIFTRCGRSAATTARRLLTNGLVPVAVLTSCLAWDAPWTFAQPFTPQSDWKTGVELQRQLNTSASVHWARGTALRPAVMNLARFQGVALFLDRRVDPDKEIEFSVSQSDNQSLWTLLQHLAGYLQQGICRIGPVIYLGPPNTAEVLATVAAVRADQAAMLPGQVGRRLERPTPLGWPELATPRDVMQQVCDAYEIDVVGLDQIPHDLWPAVDLPPLTFAQQLTLLLAGFDLTFSFSLDGSSVQLVPLPERAVIQREYTVRGDPARHAAEIRRRLPGVILSEQPGRLIAQATIEQHARIAQILSGRPAPQSGGKPPVQGETRYKLTIKNDPVGGVAAALAKNLGREVRFDPGVTEKLQQRVSFEVENATLDQLLRALLDPVGLTYQIDDQTLTILPASSQ
jgi:hypothetical protein